MRTKLIVPPAVILIASLLLCGCGEDRYAIEKKYYYIQKQVQKIYKNPLGSPPNELQRVVDSLHDFAKTHPNTNFALDAEFNIANLFIVQKEYDQARSQLTSIINNNKRTTNVCAEAVFLTGNTYEIENKWDDALIYYKKIMHDYPLTMRGLSTPIYIAEHYKIKFQPDKMITACKEAIDYYTQLANSFKYTDSAAPLVYNLNSLITECYVMLKDWQNAINTLEAMVDANKNKRPVDRELLTIASIYRDQLNDQAKTKETLEKLLRDYPRSRVIPIAQQMLKKLKEK